MCEILGITALKEFDVTPVLEPFYAHSVDHPDGWGMAVLGTPMPCVEKEPSPAFRSAYLKARLSAPIYADCVLGHIRKASVGKNEYRSCHPFTMQDNRGRCWTLMHNGTVFHEPDVSKYAAMQQGDTDSERILCALIDRIDRRQTELHRKLRFTERFRLIENLMSGLAEGNQLNVMIHDGEMLYVHANMPGRLFVHQTEERVILATSPLWENGWEPAPLCTLLAYRSGRLVRTGHPHGYAYDFSRDPQTEQQTLQNEFSLL